MTTNAEWQRMHEEALVWAAKAEAERDAHFSDVRAARDECDALRAQLAAMTAERNAARHTLESERMHLFATAEDGRIEATRRVCAESALAASQAREAQKDAALKKALTLFKGSGMARATRDVVDAALALPHDSTALDAYGRRVAEAVRAEDDAYIREGFTDRGLSRRRRDLDAILAEVKP
jgi:hypothetical protein